jgi:DNA primase
MVTKEYLEYELGLKKVKELSSGWIMACCPFHQENRPSFGVNKETGVYNCFACGASGNLADLISFCKGISVADAVKEITKSAKTLFKQSSLVINLDKRKEDIILSKTILKEYAYYHPYLIKRGISKETLKKFAVGYDITNRAVTFPFFDLQGNLRTIKYRKVDSKQFWYYPGGEDKSKLLYLIHAVKGLKRVYIVEGEVDALYCWENGLPAVALSGSWMTKEQAKLLLSTGVKEVVIFTDNDSAGEKAKNRIISLLSRRRVQKFVEYTLAVKDPNEMPKDVIRNLTLKPVPLFPCTNQLRRRDI